MHNKKSVMMKQEYITANSWNTVLPCKISNALFDADLKPQNYNQYIPTTTLHYALQHAPQCMLHICVPHHHSISYILLNCTPSFTSCFILHFTLKVWRQFSTANSHQLATAYNSNLTLLSRAPLWKLFVHPSLAVWSPRQLRSILNCNFSSTFI